MTTKIKSSKTNSFLGWSAMLSKSWISNQKWMKTSILNKNQMTNVLLSKPVPETPFSFQFPALLKAHYSDPENLSA